MFKKWVNLNTITAGVITSGTILGFWNDYFKNLNTQGLIGVIFLGVIAVWAFALSLLNTRKYKSKVGYADVFNDLNAGFTGLHALDRKSEDELTETVILNSLSELCTRIARTFYTVKGHACGVCIKLILEKRGKARVFTFARDESSLQQGRITGKMDDKEHWISENTDFDTIFRNIKKGGKTYYISGNLPYETNYKNTKLPELPNAKKAWYDFLIKGNKFLLEYRSTLVVPLLPYITQGSQDGLKIRGFLCVDSPKTNVFNEQADVQILKGIADGLYNKIDKLHTKLNPHDKSKK